MAVEKFDGATGNEPGAIAHDIVLVSRDSVIMPVLTVYGVESTQVASSIQLLSVRGRDRVKPQDINLLWGVDRGKYTPLMYKMSNNILRGHHKCPTTMLEAYRLLINYRNDAS